MVSYLDFLLVYISTGIKQIWIWYYSIRFIFWHLYPYFLWVPFVCIASILNRLLQWIVPTLWTSTLDFSSYFDQVGLGILALKVIVMYQAYIFSSLSVIPTIGYRKKPIYINHSFKHLLRILFSPITLLASQLFSFQINMTNVIQVRLTYCENVIFLYLWSTL